MGARYLNEEQKKQFRERRNKTMLERYGVKSFTDVDKVKKTKLERYGDENYNNNEKHIKTCLEKYSVEHHNKVQEIANKISKTKLLPETQEKYEATMIERYGAPSVDKVPGIRNKYLSTLGSNYGVDNPLKTKEIKERQLDTLRKNGNFNSSKAEDDLYDIACKYFGNNNVLREYNKDERYPFCCDFYIPSEDLFIELNLHPSHGKHPFDPNNEEDVKLLESLKEKDDRWSRMIVDVWADRDVRKIKTASSNNLNYITIYSYKDYENLVNCWKTFDKAISSQATSKEVEGSTTIESITKKEIS